MENLVTYRVRVLARTGYRTSAPTMSGGTGLTKDAPSEVPAGAAALAKGLSLLDLVADAEHPLRFSELQAQSGLPKPTFARILRTLIAFGLVRQDDRNGYYVLGHRFLQLSHKVWETFDLTAFASPVMRDLSAELGETVTLFVLDDDKVRYVDEQSGIGLGVRIDPGLRVPLHSSAAGKALLAFQEPGVSRSLLSSLRLDRYTGTTITSMEKLQAELTLTRARGYAISIEEHLPGVNSVAVAITGKDGLPLGGISVHAPSSRMSEAAMHPVGRDLIAAARRVTGSAGAVAISSHPRPRSREGDPENLECVLAWGAQLGESPFWHPQEKRLYWVDILKPCICRFDPATGRNETRDIGKLVSAVLPASDGRLLLATQDGLEWFDFADGAVQAFASPEAEIPENRLNDAKIGPDGAVWIGSMRIDASRPTGALYRVLRNGQIEVKETGLAVSNGLGWSPDRDTLYFVDTVPGQILAYHYSAETGAISGKRIFAKIPEADGRPGGLAVDAEGGVWVTIWDGWRINRYRPDGGIDRSIDLPVPRPTSLSFGGEDLKTLYITTARTRLPASILTEAPLSGGIFACRPGEGGQAEQFF